MDPAYPRQWHLHNDEARGMDINVVRVWERNITGRGITAAVVDDGLEWHNPDLYVNYNMDASWDLNDKDSDPSPTVKSGSYFVFKLSIPTCSGGSKEGGEGRAPWVQILSISCTFWVNLAKSSYLGPPCRVGAPTSRKSWIRH